MYRISELASKVGLSRSALLYYEKQDLIQGRRLDNGYRVYNDHDVQRIRLIQRLQAGGLTLKECQSCLQAKVDRHLLLERLKALDEEIAQKQQSRQLLAAMLGEGDTRSWHEQTDKLAPDAHLDWLKKQGFNEKEALRLKWLSKNMNEHEQYMADFMTVFETLERWGPGSESETLRALKELPSTPKKILEIGCGKGLATTILATHSGAEITAVDNEPSALEQLTQRLETSALSSQVTPVCASMTELPFESSSFELIWAEGSAYIMGVTNALSQWKPLLQRDGLLMVSDMVWLTDSPSQKAQSFFQSEYPDMQTVETRLEQMTAAGYEVVSHFTLSLEAWQNYYEPLKRRIETLAPTMAESTALKDIAREVDVFNHTIGEYGYQMFTLKKKT
ncbi:MerR family transcriptional regulator [Vibrio sp. ZSDZ65]|uniref:MerR family transcriptional regulator n=1 Tax=Vibrio qingdaonensis TaxID=2829491 RepID=A0A9X3HXF2_9VIBR|nr:MerR family transcriptional regulator [Vibrio qingdaonensis]MCW8347198.1 MerR family transcriptional regulator [Vibrio qingdaonensis]